VPFDAALERPGGIVSGMTLMGAADVAMWLAIMTPPRHPQSTGSPRT
jgi:acyl-coenzyme A thioesterase PaaI-like protein